MKKHHLIEWGGGDIAQSHSIGALDPVALGLILGIPMNLSLDVADIYKCHCLPHWTEAL